MIKVHKIEVENIRSLGHAIFEPLTDGGLTAVNGPNGAGKSSLLSAMVWAIYGVTPDTGIPQTAMRRQGTVDTCRVVVDFEYDNQIITVERGLKGRNDSTYLRVSVNGVEQVFGKIGAAKAWLINLFGGLDAEGFMTAFVIRQKELDGLVKAKPAERRKLIERLAGIDRMSTAVKSAREEETEVKKRLELLPGDPEAVKVAREALEAAQNAAVDFWTSYETATDTVDAAQGAFTLADSNAQAMQVRLDEHTAAESVVTTARHAAEMAHQRATTAKRDLDATQADAVGGTDDDVTAAQVAHTAATQALQANQQAREGADRAVENANRDRARAAQAKDRAERARTSASQARTAAAAAAQRAAGFPANLAEQAQTVEADLAETTQRVGSLRGEFERLAASIKAMESTTSGDSCCPTCSTALPDPSMVLDSLREAQGRVRADGTAAGQQTKELEATLRQLRDQTAQAATAQTEARHLGDQAVTAEETANEAERDAGEAATVANESHQQAEAAKAAAMSAAQQTASLSGALEGAANTLRTAQVASAAAGRIPALRAALTAAEEAVTQADATLSAAETTASLKQVLPADRDAVFETYRTAQAALQTAERTKVEAHGNFRVAEEQTKAAEKTRDAEELRMRARAEAHELLEQKTAVKEALDFFRKDRIASLAPELSEIATDHIAKMTDGKFVAVELDEEFTPVVTDAAGTQRPASWLSGGEESAVALALRLAIGEVIAGQQGGLLWMDEPQTAMDASRRPAMMSVIRELTGRQPIIISHVTEATDMADLVLEVVPDEENGSTVVITEASVGVDEALLDAIDA